MLNLPFILSIVPLVLFLYLLLWKKESLLKTSVITLILTTLLAVFYWQIIPKFLFVSYTKGFFVALDIFIIILGAIFFLEILKDFNVIKNISYYLESFSRDYRVQVILLAWFFENFLEGTAGFGTAGAIVAPLLVGLGLSPIKAVIIALLGNSASVVFGAAGTPIRIGFEGLNTTSVPYIASLINLVGFIVPVFILWVLVSDKQNRKQEFLECLPFAIWSGILFVVPSFLSVPLGQEFPSILGSIIGLLIILLSTRFKIFIPRNNRFLREVQPPKETLSHLKTFLPYALLVFLLIFGKLLFGNYKIAIGGIGHSFNLFNPGFAFIITGLLTGIFWGSKKKITSLAGKTALQRATEPFFVIISMSAIVQIMINSGSIILIAKSFETSLLPFWTPFIGAFGSFLTGSATISNIMFGNFLNIAAGVLSFDAAIILSLALVGAAAGNMIALADILAAEAVVGLKNKERQVIKGVIVPCLIYVFFAGVIGIFITGL